MRLCYPLLHACLAVGEFRRWKYSKCNWSAAAVTDWRNMLHLRTKCCLLWWNAGCQSVACHMCCIQYVGGLVLQCSMCGKCWHGDCIQGKVTATAYTAWWCHVCENARNQAETCITRDGIDCHVLDLTQKFIFRTVLGRSDDDKEARNDVRQIFDICAILYVLNVCAFTYAAEQR